MTLGGMSILMVLILSIHERRISSHLFVSSSAFSSMFYSFQDTDISHLWLYLFLSYLFFDTIAIGIDLFISFSDSLLLIYRNATDFYVFILYPATLTN